MEAAPAQLALYLEPSPQTSPARRAADRGVVFLRSRCLPGTLSGGAEDNVRFPEPLPWSLSRPQMLWRYEHWVWEGSRAAQWYLSTSHCLNFCQLA